MNLSKKLLCFTLMLFCLQSFAADLSIDLQKACVNEQLSEHSGIKGHSSEASDFDEYCKCESDYIIKKATKEQLNQISKDLNVMPKWLQKLKSKALKSCLEQEKKITS